MKGLIPEFIEIVKKECLKRSIFVSDGTLRHVGWLGAVPPAIKTCLISPSAERQE